MLDCMRVEHQRTKRARRLQPAEHAIVLYRAENLDRA